MLLVVCSQFPLHADGCKFANPENTSFQYKIPLKFTHKSLKDLQYAAALMFLFLVPILQCVSPVRDPFFRAKQ